MAVCITPLQNAGNVGAINRRPCRASTSNVDTTTNVSSVFARVSFLLSAYTERLAIAALCCFFPLRLCSLATAPNGVWNGTTAVQCSTVAYYAFQQHRAVEVGVAGEAARRVGLRRIDQRIESIVHTCTVRFRHRACRLRRGTVCERAIL